MMALSLWMANMKIHQFPVAKGDYQLQHRNAQHQFSDGQCRMGSWSGGFLFARWESLGNAWGYMITIDTLRTLDKTRETAFPSAQSRNPFFVETFSHVVSSFVCAHCSCGSTVSLCPQFLCAYCFSAPSVPLCLLFLRGHCSCKPTVLLCPVIYYTVTSLVCLIPCLSKRKWYLCIPWQHFYLTLGNLKYLESWCCKTRKRFPWEHWALIISSLTNKNMVATATTRIAVSYNSEVNSHYIYNALNYKLTWYVLQLSLCPKQVF